MPTVHAVRYMARFRCLQELCEDTCCQGLKIPVDAPSFARLRELLAATPERFRESIALEAEPEDASAVAHVRMRDDGSCPFFTDDRRCALHAAHGEAALPDACAIFPRALAATAGRLELTGSLACPEVARLCLLGEDAAGWEELDAAKLPRPRPAPAPREEAGTDLAFRETALELCRLAAYPLSTRVILLAHLAVEPDPARYRAFAAELAEPIHRNFAQLSLDGGKVAVLLLRVLDARLGSAHGPRFAALASSVRGQLERAATSSGDGAFAEYRRARDELDARFGPKLDLLLQRYCASQLLRAPVSELPSPVAYVARLALRLCQVRFFLALHAAALGVATSADLERAAVEVVQLLAKHLEQHPAFREAVQGALDCPDADRFGRTLVFAKFL